MLDSVENNKRLAKNTIILYFRMGFLVLINLYISRLILDTLGVEDYGIYNVVGGFVMMFSLLSASLSNSISRFITFEIGRDNLEKLKVVFSNSVTVQLILAIIIGVLIEIIGVWFLNFKMQIPNERLVAANWTLQCSIITFMLNLISVPYNGCIIAHERMTAFAYISIFDVLLKLGSVLLLYIAFIDNLILYSIAVALSALVIRVIYGIYCKRNFSECTYRFMWNKKLVKEMLSLASWNMLGSGAGILNDQGVNVVMNLYFGVTVNAARGLANQVNTAVQQFAASFVTALNPQITKLYAQNNYDDMQTLLHKGIKYSFFLMYIIALPLFLETPAILEIWLKNVPPYTVSFVRITICTSLIAASGNLLFTTIMATGHIRKYQLVVGCLAISVFICSSISFYLGAPPISTYVINFVFNVLILFARLVVINNEVNIGLNKIIKDVFVRILYVVFLSLFLPLFIYVCVDGILRTMLVTLLSPIFTTIVIWIIGLTNKERTVVRKFLHCKLGRLFLSNNKYKNNFN